MAISAAATAVISAAILRQRRFWGVNRIMLEASAVAAGSLATVTTGDGASANSRGACDSNSHRSPDTFPHLGPRLDRPDHLVEHAELESPRLHDRLEVPIDGHHGLDLRPLIGIEGAEGIFRGERDMVFAIGHFQSPNSLIPGITRIRL